MSLLLLFGGAGDPPVAVGGEGEANAYGYENVGLEANSSKEANAYGYENVGPEVFDYQGAHAYGYENVGIEFVLTFEGNAYGYAHIGYDWLIIPGQEFLEGWGTLLQRARDPIADSQLDGNAYGYENVLP